jgi:hypothetical protein
MAKPVEPKRPNASVTAKPRVTIRRDPTKMMGRAGSGRNGGKATRSGTGSPEATGRASERRPAAEAAPAPVEDSRLESAPSVSLASAPDIAIPSEPTAIPQVRTEPAHIPSAAKTAKEPAHVPSAAKEPAHVSLAPLEADEVRSAPAERGQVVARPAPKASPKAPSRESIAVATAAAMARTTQAWAETAIDVRHEMIAFAWRQTELGLTSSCAILTSGSLPGALSHQATYVGEALSAGLTHALELARLSNRMVCAGLESLRPD